MTQKEARDNLILSIKSGKIIYSINLKLHTDKTKCKEKTTNICIEKKRLQMGMSRQQDSKQSLLFKNDSEWLLLLL